MRLSQFYLALHSYGQKVIYPWSYTEKKVADWKQLQKMGEVMARAIHKKSDGGVQYTVRSYYVHAPRSSKEHLKQHLCLTGRYGERAPVPRQRRLRRLGQVTGHQVGLPHGAAGRGQAPANDLLDPPHCASDTTPCSHLKLKQTCERNAPLFTVWLFGGAGSLATTWGSNSARPRRKSRCVPSACGRSGRMPSGGT